jgi:hypothetical protein
MFQYFPSLAMKEVLDSVSSMSPGIVMKDDGVHCPQMPLLSPECWTNAIMREIVMGTLQHKRGDYLCCRMITAGHQQKWTH